MSLAIVVVRLYLVHIRRKAKGAAIIIVDPGEVGRGTVSEREGEQARTLQQYQLPGVWSQHGAGAFP